MIQFVFIFNDQNSKPMPPILITSCSNRKSGSPDDRLTPNDVPRGSLSDVSKAWIQKLKSHKNRVTVEELYSGRGAYEAKLCAKILNANHWIVSAGLGLVHSNENVPLYDLTVSGNNNSNIKNKITDINFTTEQWWHELSKRRRPKRTISSLVKSTRSIIILAIPSNYFKMLSNDLATLNNSQLRRLRIIGPVKSNIPQRFHEFLLPYDDRLDGPNSPIPGTRSDFPQRSAHHFAKFIWPNAKSHRIESHSELVRESLRNFKYPISHKRKKMSDEEIIKIILRQWKNAEGQSGRMIRILRDDKQIACEQNRFKSLFYIAKNQIG